MIFDQNGAVVCLRKRTPDDVSTYVLSVEMQALVSRFFPQGASVVFA